VKCPISVQDSRVWEHLCNYCATAKPDVFAVTAFKTTLGATDNESLKE